MVDSFRFLAVFFRRSAVNTKYGDIFLTAMQHMGICFGGRWFLFVGGNVNVNPNVGRYCDASLCFWSPNLSPAVALVPFERLVCTAISDEEWRQNQWGNYGCPFHHE